MFDNRKLLYLAELVSKASTLEERKTLNGNSSRDRGGSHHLTEMYSKWMTTVADDSRDDFVRRLSLDGLDVNSAHRALLDPPTNSDRLPEWSILIGEVLEEMTNYSSRSALHLEDDAVLQSGKRLPFDRFYTAFVQNARKKVKASAGRTYFGLSANAHTDMERSLLERLTNIGGLPMYSNFAAYRAFHSDKEDLEKNYSNLRREEKGYREGKSVKNKSTTLYDEYVDKLFSGRAKRFFGSYPVLARYVGQATHFWINFYVEFLNRLRSDRSIIQKAFGKGVPLGKGVKLKTGLSDPHCNGQSVIILEFSSGERVVYKPRNMATDKALDNFIKWINGHKGLASLKTVQVVNRLTHGWAEFVASKPCLSNSDAQKYYRRAGSLLCIMYVLNGADLHHENVIASGSHPLLIDVEVLAYPLLSEMRTDHKRSSEKNQPHLTDTVDAIGLLPLWVRTGDGNLTDIGGLSGQAKGKTHFIQRLLDINSDRMMLRKEKIKHNYAELHNTPHINGEPLNVSDYIEEVLCGFESTYIKLLEEHDELLDSDGPLAPFSSVPVRIVPRPTKTYQKMIQRVRHPSLLRNGTLTSIELEKIYKPVVKYKLSESLYLINKAEKSSLQQLDVPLFRTDTGSLLLEAPSGEKIEDVFQETGYTRLLSKVRSLSRRDLKYQKEVIRTSFHTLDVNANSGFHVVESLRSSMPLNRENVLSRKEASKEAISIANSLIASSAPTVGELTTWVTLYQDGPSGKYQLMMTGSDLYGGLPGIALLFASLYKVTGNAAYREKARSMITMLTKKLMKRSKHRAKRLYANIGGTSGWGGAVYALTKLSWLIDDKDLLLSALKAAHFVTPELIKESRPGVSTGSAGAILGLLSLYEATGSEVAIEKAIQCSHHIVRNSVVVNDETVAWRTLDGSLTSGFAHGASGVAMSLAALYRQTQDQMLLDTVFKALKFLDRHHFSKKSVSSLRRVYDADNMNAGVLEASQKVDFASEMNAWCHGDTGIGLSLLSIYGRLKSELGATGLKKQIKRSIMSTIETTKRDDYCARDHLCCGNFGRLDLLIEASLVFSDSGLLDTSRIHAKALLEHSEKAGGYVTEVGKVHNQPGLFTGMAGIAYEYLRLSNPKLIPSVLLWD